MTPVSCAYLLNSFYLSKGRRVTRVYRSLEALSYISLHQFLIHLVHISFETVQSFCSFHLCLTTEAIIFLFYLLLLIIIIRIIKII